MRSHRSPAKPNTSTVAESMSRARASRSSARARKRRVRTVAAGIERHAAVSSTVMSSTSRMTKTVLKATGNASIRRSRMRRTSARNAALVGDSDFSSATSSTAGSRSVGVAAERDDHAVALLAPQPHQRLIDHDAGEPGGELRFATEVADPAIRFEVRILHRVLRLGVILEDRSCDTEQLAVVPAHEGLEGCLLPTHDATHEVGIGAGIGSRNSRRGQAGHGWMTSYWMHCAPETFPAVVSDR